jgi:hypothetical protein
MSYLVSFMLFPAVLGYVEVSDALDKSTSIVVDALIAGSHTAGCM